MTLEPDGISYPDGCDGDPHRLGDDLDALEHLRCVSCGERRPATWKEARVLWFGLGVRAEEEGAMLRDKYDDWCEWEEAAERLYEHLNPGKSWHCVPAVVREEWIRGLQD